MLLAVRYNTISLCWRLQQRSNLKAFISVRTPALLFLCPSRGPTSFTLCCNPNAPPSPFTKARIQWVRQKTQAVTKVHLAAAVLTQGGDGGTSGFIREDPASLEGKHGQQQGKVGFVRPADGPLPTILVWVDRDDGSPCQPPHDSLGLEILGSSWYVGGGGGGMA